MPGDTLRILCWEGYEADSILAPFRARHRVEATGEALLSDADAAHRVAADDRAGFDVLNINNAWVRDFLHPRGCVRPLSAALAQRSLAGLLDGFEGQYGWMTGADGTAIGICQRFGAFNLVVDTRRVAETTARDLGFDLANEAAADGPQGLPFGVLTYDDFNVFHVAIGAGLDPFRPFDGGAFERFEATARAWFGAARVVTDDHHRLNAALVSGEIAFYVSGGVYTVSPARMDGHSNLRAVTPARGPIDGCGGIAFTEITALLSRDSPHPLGEAFLEYLLEPTTAVKAAFAGGTCNPVAQLGDERVRAAFTVAELDAIQFDSLADDLSRCADYQLVPDGPRLLACLRAARG